MPSSAFARFEPHPALFFSILDFSAWELPVPGTESVQIQLNWDNLDGTRVG